MDKPEKYSNEIKEKFYLVDEIEAYHKWVLEPIVEVFEKYKEDNKADKLDADVIKYMSWQAIQETLKRSEG